MKSAINFCIFCLIILCSSCQKDYSPLGANEIDEYIPGICLSYNKVDKNYHWQAYLNDMRGTNLQNISNNPVNDAYYPMWSPDGKFIIFRYDKPLGGTDIYRYDVFNKTKINLTGDLADNESVDPVMWTPDGEYIIYTFRKLGVGTKTCIMDKDGSHKRDLFEFTTSFKFYFFNDNFHFLHNGSEIDMDKKIYLSDLSGNSTIFLDNEGTDKAEYWCIQEFNPNTEEILTSKDIWGRDLVDNFVKYNIKNGEYKTLFEFEKGWIIQKVKYSHDYSKIVFPACNLDERKDKLFIYENGKIRELLCFTFPEWLDYHPFTFSPNDTYIAYSKNVYGEGFWINWKSYLYIVNINTGVKKFIDIGVYPQWNPLWNY